MRTVKPTKKDVIHFNVLLHQRGMTDQKRDLIYWYTHGRTDRTLLMKSDELKQLIRSLEGKEDSDMRNKVRRGIFSFSHTMCLINDTMNSTEKMEAINEYIAQHSKISLKKHINAYTLPELQKLFWQFKVFSEHYLNKLSEYENNNDNQ
jgi:hypothetical protein